MTPVPDCGERSYVGHGRLRDTVAVITGGASGIGRAVAVANFSASLAGLLGERGIRVNSVAPGPIWTASIPSTMPPAAVARAPIDPHGAGYRLAVTVPTPGAESADPESADRSVTRHGRARPGAAGSGWPAIDRQVADLVAPAAGDGPVGPVVEIVDIGANPIDGEPPYRPLLDGGWGRVTGFEPQREALADLRRHAGPHERYLPHAVGDGERHTFHLCATSGFAGLLEPDERQLELLTDFTALARVTGHEPVDTCRLDDIDEIAAVDFLKIDIQGGELAVLRAGRGKLRRAVAVQTEVGFHRLYREQPTFAEVDLELRRQGFVPHQFVTSRTWPIAPVVWADPLERAARHLVEADLLYVRDPVRLADCDDAQLGRMALIADIVYGSVGLALRCVLALIDRGVLAPDAAGRYRRLAARWAG